MHCRCVNTYSSGERQAILEASDLWSKVLTNPEYFQLRVPSCIALLEANEEAAADHCLSRVAGSD